MKMLTRNYLNLNVKNTPARIRSLAEQGVSRYAPTFARGRYKTCPYFFTCVIYRIFTCLNCKFTEQAVTLKLQEVNIPENSQDQ
jgi:hypothetical protein